MHRKYLEERIPAWFIHGASPDGQFVNLADYRGDILTHLPREQAYIVLAERDALLKVIALLLGTSYPKFQKAVDLYNQEKKRRIYDQA